MRKLHLIAGIALVACSCHETSNNQPLPAQKAMKAEAVAVDTSLSNLAFASKKDPSCGMPLKAGLTDTISYKGKLYGFCSKECKADFLKDPAAHLAALK